MTDNLLTDRQTYNVVSLGYFCSVAKENERIGVRNRSLPFDWVISSDFEQVIYLIKSKFENFMVKDNLFQEYDINPKYYYDSGCNIHFYHDFSPCIPFEDQYDEVREKYCRRIKRFYDTIKSSTLFIRYISSQDEADYICENYTDILSCLRDYNSENFIIFVANEQIQIKADIEVYFVKNDKGDSVARKYLKQLPTLRKKLQCTTEFHKILKNIIFYEKKQIKSSASKIKNKLFNKLFHVQKDKFYYYDKQWISLNK